MQTLFPRDTGVSVPAKAPLALQWGCHFFLDNTNITGEHGQRPGGQAPQLPQPGQAQPVPSRVPPGTPNLEYITAIESVCTNLSQQDAEEIRANINRVLRSSHPQVKHEQGISKGYKGIKR